MNNKLNILMADDDDINLEILSKTILSEGHSIILAKDGDEAWSKILEHANKIELVILDRMMPGLEGIEIAQKIKSTDHIKHLPIILQSGKTESEVFLHSFEAGVMFYLKKPFMPIELAHFVNVIINYKKQNEVLQKLLNNNQAAKNGSYRCRDFNSIYNLAAQIALLSNQKPDIANALTEIMINSLEHGNYKIGRTKDNLLRKKTYWQKIEQELAQDSQGILVDVDTTTPHKVNVQITDSGTGFDYESWKNFNSDNITKLCGRGIYKARQFLDISYQNHGNIALCSFNTDSSI